MDAPNASPDHPSAATRTGIASASAGRMTTAEMLARLVAFDTTSRNSNLKLIEFVRGYLDAHGVPYRVSTDPTGQKANIHAIVGPHAAGGVALSGHVDTVPVDGQAWSADPFALRAGDGQAVRARRLRHEGLRRRLPRRGARLPGDARCSARCICSSATTRKPMRRRASGWSRTWTSPA